MPPQLFSKTSKSFSIQPIAAHSFEPMALMRLVLLLFTVTLLPLLSPTLSRAQSIQYTHNKPDQAMRSAMRVDPATLGLSIEVPIAGYPGRGGTSVPINLSYSSKQWRIDFYDSWLAGEGSPRTESRPKFSEWAKGGWTSSADIPAIDWIGHSQCYNGDGTGICETYATYYINRIRVHMPGGSSHELRIDDTPVTTLTYAGTYFAVDGSNIRYEATSISDGILYLPDGSRYLLLPSTTGYQYVDRNGNTLSYNMTNRQWTDTQARVLDVPLPASPSATTYTYNLPSTTSTPVSYSVRWSTLANALTNPGDELRYKTNMIFGIGESWTPRSPALFVGDGDNRLYDDQGFPASEKFNPMVLAEIILPNGQHYLFTYNVWGEITKVIYPTGAYERFDYAAVAGVGFLKPPYAQGNRGVVDRWLSPTGSGADEVHWHYAAAASSFVLTVSTTAPDNTLSEQLMSAETSEGNDAFGFSHVEIGMPFEERVFAPTSAGGGMLRRTLTSWTSSGPTSGGWYTATRNPRVAKKVSILLDTGTSNALTSTTTMSYDDDLNVIATNHYDFTSISQSSAQTSAIGSISASPTLLRTVEATYLVNDTAINLTTRSAYRNRNLLSLPTSARVKNGSGTIVAQTQTSYDETGAYPLLTYSGTISGWSDPSTNVRGLPTTTGVWLNTTSSYLQTHAQYDQFGNVRNTWDANGNQSQTTYSSTYSYAYPTSATTAVPDPTGLHGSTTALSTTAEYNANTGLMTSLTDPNGQTASYAYDAINRPATITRPSGGGSTSYAYGDTPGNLYVRTHTSLDSTRVAETYQYYDKLGRPCRTFLNEGSTYATTDMQYDSMGRSWRSSNPYRTTSLTADVNPDEYWNTNAYDYLGRVTSVTTPDGAVVTSAYSGSTSTPLGPVVTVTDQAGRLRRSLTDAQGRLARVDEPDLSSSTGTLGTVASPQQATSYSYDTLGNLLEVTQGSQTRTFGYDSLSRLRSALNPESGTVNYTYDDNGNLLTRTDARGVVSTYAYDALNRNKSVVYTNDLAGTATVTRVYDGATNGKGRLWKTETAGANGSRTTINIFDALGKPTSQSQLFYAGGAWSQPFTVSATYSLSGQVLTLAYPSGHMASYSYDNADRTSSFAGNLGDTTQRTYSSEVIYSAFGSMAKEKFGTGTAIYNKLFYNSRGQLAEIRASTSYTGPTDTTGDRGVIINHYSNQPGCWGATCNATDNNGNLRRQEIYIPNSDTFAQFYEYDSLNRLQSVRENRNGGAINWQQTYIYDRYGNRRIDTNPTQTFGGVNNVGFELETAANRLYAPGDLALPETSRRMQYDPAGNLKNDTYTGQGQRTYDAENRMKQAWSNGRWQTYSYDGDGRRVKRNVGGVETWQVYGLGGELIAEYAQNGPASTPQKEYGYRNGQLLIIATAPAGLAANKLPNTGRGAGATESSAASREPKIGATQSGDLLASNKSSDLPQWAHVGEVTEVVSDISTPLYGPSFSYASLRSSVLPAVPQSGPTKIAFASNREGTAQLYSMNTDGSGLLQLTDDAANDEAPNWSPNNSRIVFQSDRDNLFSGSAEIYVMNWDGSGQMRLTSAASDDSAPVWSPDGTKIAFQSARNGVNYQVYVMNADGSGQVNISNNISNDGQPSWSPDGTKIAFASDRDHPGTYSVYVMNANGSSQTRLTFSDSAFRDEQPAWSPDGTKLAFTSTRDSVVDTWQETDDEGGVLTRTAVRSNKEVYVMNADGSAQVRLTNTLENDDSASWSGDGTKIVFRSERERDCCDPTPQVWVMNPDGSSQVNLSDNPYGDHCPSWQHVASNLSPTVSVTSPANGASFIAPANITASASDSDGTISKVDFYQGTTLIGTDTVAPYSFNWNNVAAGSYSLTARATDNNGATSTSAAVNITVNAVPTVSITSPANGASFTSLANIPISANASDSNGTISKVDFYQGTTLIGTDTTAPYSFNWNNVAAGSYSLTARATDNDDATSTSGAVTVSVNALPAVSITSPANGANFTAPANITITANASDSGGSISRVDFYQGTTLIGTSTASPYTISWNNVAAGSYSLTARATDNLDATTTSTAVSITVNAPPTVSITSPANGASFTAPANIIITANASDGGGSINRVDFYQGNSLIGTDATAPYTITWNNVAAGGYVLTARAIDNLGAITNSNPVNITVGSPPTVSITSPANGATFTAQASITITADASAGGGINRVEFYQGTIMIGTATTSPYAMTWNNASAGSYALTARAVDSLGTSSDSTPVNITVNAPPAASVTSPTTGASFSGPANITMTANASDSDGSISRVDFYQGTALIGTAMTTPYVITWNDVAAGSYSLTAKATDDLGAQTNSSPVSITVTTPPTVAEIRWVVTDQLGTPRMSFDETGSLANVSRHDYLPFGEEIYAGTGGRTPAQGYTLSDNVRQKFTSKERDIETGLDFFEARYYASMHGRFTSADEPFADQSVDNPQSWNLYSYVRNNPLVMVDPTGRRTGDYYDSSGNWVYSDNIRDDRVYVVAVCNEPDGSVNYTDPRDLGITHTQFKITSNIVRQEGTSTDPQEYSWIAHTSHNEAAAINSSLYDVLQTGFSSAPDKTTGLATTNTSVQANASRAGVIDVLTGGADPTGGARRWDGTDFLAWGLNSPNGTPHNKFEEFTTIDIPGATYTTYLNAQRARWGNTVNYGTRRYNIPAAVFTNAANWTNGNFHYVTGARNATQGLTATGARGHTIFWRF